MTWIFWLLSLLGHVMLCVGVINRWHSVGTARWLVKVMSFLALIWIPLGFFMWVGPFFDIVLPGKSLAEYQVEFPEHFQYAALLHIAAIIGTGMWIKRRFIGDHYSLIDPVESRNEVNIEAETDEPLYAGGLAKFCRLWPWNESWTVEFNERTWKLQNLPAELAGLKIVHLSDLHMTGSVTRKFFEIVCDKINALNPDLIFLTGDIVDEAQCIDWLPSSVGTLRARYGVFYVLGNHDLRTRDLPRLHQTLKECGLHDIGSSWRVVPIRDTEILIAGNELPWLGQPIDMQHAPTHRKETNPSDRSRLFRILLSHSPDQFGYAAKWDFDLVFAGHNHGGQIAFPIIGPIFSPSWHGVRFSNGTFQRNSTRMHVSRGISGEQPIRWNAMPEVSLFELEKR